MGKKEDLLTMIDVAASMILSEKTKLGMEVLGVAMKWIRYINDGDFCDRE